MTHQFLRVPLRDKDDADNFVNMLSGYTAQGYKVLSCGVTDDGRLVWAILQKKGIDFLSEDKAKRTCGTCEHRYWHDPECSACNEKNGFQYYEARQNGGSHD